MRDYWERNPLPKYGDALICVEQKNENVSLKQGMIVTFLSGNLESFNVKYESGKIIGFYSWRFEYAPCEPFSYPLCTVRVTGGSDVLF